MSRWDREILQLADIVAYSAGEYMNHGTAPEHDSYLWQQIRRCMALHQKSGRRLGAGFSMYPKSVRIPVGEGTDA